MRLGLAYEKTGRYPEAIEQFKLATSFAKGHQGEDEARYNLGMANLSANNKAAAMEQYEALKTMKSAYADSLLSEINKH
jgi:tetratricopeptide (TPR) repeat protein